MHNVLFAPPVLDSGVLCGMQKASHVTPSITTSPCCPPSLGNHVLWTEGRVPMHNVLFSLQC